jgi:hypothetical protein
LHFSAKQKMQKKVGKRKKEEKEIWESFLFFFSLNSKRTFFFPFEKKEVLFYSIFSVVFYPSSFFFLRNKKNAKKIQVKKEKMKWSNWWKDSLFWPKKEFKNFISFISFFQKKEIKTRKFLFLFDFFLTFYGDRGTWTLTIEKINGFSWNFIFLDFFFICIFVIVVVREPSCLFMWMVISLCQR